MEVVKWLSIADRYTRMYLDRCLAPLGLNSSQHKYVLMICENPGITQDQFFNFFYVNPSNITRALSGLEKEGFIEKNINPVDKRTCRLYPTQKAKEAYDKILTIIEDWEKDLLADLSAEERKQFGRWMQKIAEKSVKL